MVFVRPNFDGDVRRLLAVSPQPLINYFQGFGVIWSAKSACTNVLVWTLIHMGLLDRALAHDPWPHEFRDVFFIGGGSEYQKALDNVAISSLPWLRVIRDPARRVVSSFRHALRYGYENANLTKALGRTIDAETGFSFMDFLRYLRTLESLAVGGCNPHFCLQQHPVEKYVLDATVINIDRMPLAQGLRAFERTLGLTWSDGQEQLYRATLKNIVTNVRPGHWAARYDAAADMSEDVLRSGDTVRPWPKDESFLTPRARGQIAKIYRRDFAAYADWL